MTRHGSTQSEREMHRQVYMSRRHGHSAKREKEIKEKWALTDMRLNRKNH